MHLAGQDEPEKSVMGLDGKNARLERPYQLRLQFSYRAASGGSLPTRLLPGRRLDRDMRRPASHDLRLTVGSVTYECFQKQDEFLGKHCDLTVWSSRACQIQSRARDHRKLTRKR